MTERREGMTARDWKALKQDASRYRWLRENVFRLACDPETQESGVSIDHDFGHVAATGRVAVDLAVDCATMVFLLKGRLQAQEGT